MKKNYLLLITASIVFLSSCTKDTVGSSGYLRGKMDGVSFEATGFSANKPEPVNGPDDPTVRIIGTWGSATIKVFLLSETSSLHTGEYIFQSDKDRSGTVVEGNNSYYAGPAGLFMPSTLYGSGKVTITNISKKVIEGSFEFTTSAYMGVTKTITEGQFSISRN